MYKIEIEITKEKAREWRTLLADALERETGNKVRAIAALEELRAEWLGEQIAEPQSVEESGINARIQRYVNDLDAAITALLGGTEEAKCQHSAKLTDE